MTNNHSHTSILSGHLIDRMAVTNGLSQAHFSSDYSSRFSSASDSDKYDSDDECGCRYHFSDKSNSSNSFSSDSSSSSGNNTDSLSGNSADSSSGESRSFSNSSGIGSSTDEHQPEPESTTKINPYCLRTISDREGKDAYRQEKFLGKGAYGYVHKVVNRDGRRLAMKSFRMEKVTKVEIEGEADALTKISKDPHHNIVAFIRRFEHNGSIFMLLELCGRMNMWQLLRRRGRLEEAEVRFFGQQLAEGLVHIHSLGLAHCDIKQENLMFSDKLELKIGDFRMAEDVLQYDHTGTPGTDSYRAPEMLAEKVHSCKVDIWSAGCVIYQMLVGYGQDIISICDIIHNNHISKVAKDLLKRMLASAPGTRMTAIEMMDHDFFKGKKQLTLATRNILQDTHAIQVINGHGVQDHSYIDTRGCKKRRIDPEEEKEFEEEAERWESEARRQKELHWKARRGC